LLLPPAPQLRAAPRSSSSSSSGVVRIAGVPLLQADVDGQLALSPLVAPDALAHGGEASRCHAARSFNHAGSATVSPHLTAALLVLVQVVMMRMMVAARPCCARMAALR
jgi:hypothetical protein